MKQKILFVVLLFAFVTISCITAVSNQKPTEQPGGNLPEWIAKEKIRAGYLLATENPKYASLIRSYGLNTVIAKGDFHQKDRFADTLKNCRRWAQACKKENLHLFIAFNWQPARESFVYRRVVYSDGSTGAVAPCPRDHEYWRTRIIYLGKVIANLSLEPDVQIDGIFFDCELYGSVGKKRHYIWNTCFCDNCFSSFLLSRGYKGENLPVVSPKDRKKWLRENQLFESYFDFLEKDTEALAREFEQELHKINPFLMIGMYPSLGGDWALKAMARGFGTDKMPMVIFGTDSYAPAEPSKIPALPRQFYAMQKINALYVAGFLLRCYSADILEQQLLSANEKSSGYWLFKISMLWRKPDKKYPLAGGSKSDYWRAIGETNRKMVKALGN